MQSPTTMHISSNIKRGGCGETLSRKTALLLMLLATLIFSGTQEGKCESRFSLDSIAAWGKFPRFCVNTYRWGDHFFNNYDSTYVQGSGYKFNVKIKTESWIDTYNFRLEDDYKFGFESRPSTSMGLWLTYMAVSVGYDMNVSKFFNADSGARKRFNFQFNWLEDDYKFGFESRPSTSMGLWLTYMAVSVGYDMNVSKFFNADSGARKRFNFQFNCSLFGAELYTITNDSYMKIDRLGFPGAVRDVDIPFHGFHSDSWGVNLYYFFNHRRYSQAAAFSYSKIQVKSGGSLYAGFSYWQQNYDMNFTGVFDDQPEASQLPPEWDNHYRVRNKNYALKIGYGYNWVFRPGWCLGVSEAPTFGIRAGYVTSLDNQRTTFAMSNRLKLSLIYNYQKRWFFGIVGMVDTNIVYDKQHTLLANNMSMEASAGFRFNLW